MAKNVNKQLWKQTQKGFRFNESHLPHITLVQKFINESDLVAVKETVGRLLEKFPSPVVTVTQTHLYEDPDGVISGWDVEKSAALYNLHSTLLHALEPFSAIGNVQSYFLDAGESVREKTMEYTSTFHDQHGLDKYAPHLTLGWGTAPLIPQPFSFPVTRIALANLGNLGTFRKILYEWKLQ